MSRRQNAVKYPCQNETDGQHHKTYQPVRYQLGGNESELADGGDIYLLDGARLLLAHHIEGREKTANQRQQHYHEGRNHEKLVVQRGVVKVLRSDVHPGKRLPGKPLRRRLRTQFTGIVTDDGKQVGSSQTALRAVHGIGRHQQTRRLSLHPILFEITGNLQHDICRTCFNGQQSLIVCIGKRCQAEISGCTDFIYQTARQDAVVIVHYIQIDVLYLQIGGPGHQYHNHARENENQLGQEGVAEQLLEFLFNEKLYHKTIF